MCVCALTAVTAAGGGGGHDTRELSLSTTVLGLKDQKTRNQTDCGDACHGAKLLFSRSAQTRGQVRAEDVRVGVTVGWEGPHTEDTTTAPYANKDANQCGPYSFVEKLFEIYVHSVCSTVLKTLGHTGEQSSPDYLEGTPTWCSEGREAGEGRHTPIPPDGARIQNRARASTVLDATVRENGILQPLSKQNLVSKQQSSGRELVFPEHCPSDQNPSTSRTTQTCHLTAGTRKKVRYFTLGELPGVKPQTRGLLG